MESFVRFLNESVVITPSSTAGAPSKNVILFGQRNTLGVLYPSSNGFPQPNLYKPFLLPSFSNGRRALNYLGNYGLKYKMGIDFTLSLPAPTAIAFKNSLTVLTWAVVPAGFTTLVGFNLSGTLAQLAVNGQVYSAEIVSGIATLKVYGTVSYIDAGSAGAVMTLTGVNNINYPDPNATDPICLMVWDFYQSALSAAPSTQGVPAAYISIVSDRDASISPTAATITLDNPTAATNDVATSTATLTFPVSTAGLGYLPTTSLSNTTVTQGTATGIYGGFEIVGTNVVITITNATGTFAITTDVDIVLDNTVTGFTYIGDTDIYGAVLQYPISTLTDITVTHADFYNGIVEYNLANKVLNKHYLCYGVAGNMTLLPSSAASLPAPNSQLYILTSYPYVAKFGDIPYDNTDGTVASGRLASASLYMLANGDAPFPPLMTATINHLPVSSIAKDISYSNQQNGTADIAINQGWLPFAPNSSGVVAFLESVTTLITIPSTTTPDDEFRYTHVWDSVRWIKREVANLFGVISVLPNNRGSALISPQFIRQFRVGIQAILQRGQTLGILENVALYTKLVKVTQDATNPNQVDAYIPAQVIPQLNGANVEINIFSSLYTFNNSNNTGA